VRQTAGLLLKNNVRAGYGGIDEGCRAFIRASLLPVLGHASRPLRHTAGTCAVTIVNLTGLGSWPELVAALAEGLDSAGDSNRVEGALDLVFKVGVGARGEGGEWYSDERQVKQHCCEVGAGRPAGLPAPPSLPAC
jgi:hypothetical protein